MYSILTIWIFFLTTLIYINGQEKCSDLSFQKPLYQGEIDALTNLILNEEVVLENFENQENLNAELVGNFTENFQIAILDNGTIDLNLIEDVYLPLEITFIALEIRITDWETKLEASSALILEIHPPYRPKFSSDLYVGRLTDDLELKALDVELTEETFLTGTKLELVPRVPEIDDTKYFEVMAVGNKVTVSTTSELTPFEVADRDHLEFNIVATGSYGEPGVTSVVIAVPSPSCLHFPSKPKFEFDSYVYFIKSDVKGLIGIVTATIEEEPSELVYSLRSDNQIMLDRVFIDPEAGSISLLEYLPSNIYYGEIVAINVGTELETAVGLTITVESTKSSETFVQHTLIVEHLEEGKDHPEILDSFIEKCNFVIESQLPVDTDFFRINPTTKKLTGRSFDREAELFLGVLVPQFQISLRLVCPEDNASSSNLTVAPSTLISDPNPGYVETSGIEFSPIHTIVSVIIVDINDNPPVFEIPEEKGMKIGYPSPELAERILPDNLIQVHAVDADEGLNAKIRYRLEDNDHFTIDEESGKIIARPNCMVSKDHVQLTVSAIDRDGAEDGLSTSTEISVHKLTVEHVVTLMFLDTEERSEEEVIDYIKNEIGINFSILRIAAIPKLAESPKEFKQILQNKTAEESSTTTEMETTTEQDLSSAINYKLLVYAFDESGELQMTDELLGIIESSGTTSVHASTVDSFDCPDNVPEEQSMAYKIATITLASVLGVLLIIVIGLGIYTYFYITKLLGQLDNDEDNSVRSSVEEVKTSSANLFFNKNSAANDSGGSNNKQASYDLRKADDSSFYPVQLSATIDDGRFSPSESVDSGNSDFYQSNKAEYAVARKPRK